MNYEFNEMNFVLMHKEVVFQVAAKSNLSTALNMMKINKVVMKQKAQSDEQYNVQPQNVDEGPSTSNSTVPSVVNVPRTPRRSKGSGQKKTKLIEKVTVATQTSDHVVSVNLAADDEEFDMFDLKAMRQQFLITTIRENNFQN